MLYSTGVPMSRGPTVLVVDDDIFMRTLLTRVLTDAGLAVETFISAQELLDKGDLTAPAVLLLDVMMPGLSGLELQALLRVRGVSIPIVFLTACSDVPMAVEAMRNGAVDFLEKPFDKAVLISRVRQSLSASASPAVPAARRANQDFGKRLETLTTREREVYEFMIKGKTSKTIARDLGGSYRTIEIHRARVMTKMDSDNLADLVRMTFEVDAEVSYRQDAPAIKP
jgi:FixJ family two-component response regulator